MELAPVQARVWPESIVLGHIALQIVNALAPPHELSSHEAQLLRKAAVRWAGPHEDTTGDAGRQQPMLHERGAYFVADILRHPTNHNILRLPAHYLSPSKSVFAIASIMRLHKVEDLSRAFFHPAIYTDTLYHPANDHLPPLGLTSSYKIMRTIRRDPWLFGHHHSHPTLHPLLVMKGPDVTPTPILPPPFRALIEENSLAHTLHHIYYQFLHDMLAKVPAPRSQPLPYLIFTTGQRENIRPAIFQQPILPFTDVIYQVPSQKTWRDNFLRFFPARDHSPNRTPAHFPQCLYYQAWLDVIFKLTDPQVNVARFMIECRFNELHWVAHCENSSMWNTAIGLPSTRWRHFSGTVQNAPHILINPFIYVSADHVQEVFTLRHQSWFTL